jgi:hypothetical protein
MSTLSFGLAFSFKYDEKDGSMEYAVDDDKNCYVYTFKMTPKELDGFLMNDAYICGCYEQSFSVNMKSKEEFLHFEINKKNIKISHNEYEFDSSDNMSIPILETEMYVKYEKTTRETTKEKIAQLESEVMYQPEGEGYKNAKKEFEQLAESTTPNMYFI